MPAFSVTAANVLASQQGQGSVFSGTAGATITQGQPVYLDSVTNTWKLANALNANSASNCGGISLVSTSNGQPITVCPRDPNFTPGFTINAGNLVLVGNVAGSLQPVEDRTTGWYVTSLGIGIGANRMNFFITGSNTAM